MPQLVIVLLESFTFNKKKLRLNVYTKFSATMPQLVIVLLEAFNFSNELKFRFLQNKFFW